MDKTMNIEELKSSGRILYDAIVGSNAYGTNDENSDEDHKGLFWIPSEDFLSLNPPITAEQGQISCDKHDNTYYSLFEMFKFLKKANPNMLELLWIPEDCEVKTSKTFEHLKQHRDLFVTKQAYHSHAKYAAAQIKKAKGKNKKVMNPQPEERPVREDFCSYIHINDLQAGVTYNGCIQKNRELNIDPEAFGFDPDEEFPVKPFEEKLESIGFPFRPLPIKGSSVNLGECHVASLEKCPDIYRLYHYGEQAKGVFRGDGMLVCESISKEDEWNKVIGLLIYNENEYNRAVNDWKSYWTWVKNRNPNRWDNQEKGLNDYDAKNMSHCMRLMMESKNILTPHIGHPIVRFEGEDLQLLKDIKNGTLEYDDIMSKVGYLEEELEDLFYQSNLPDEVDEEAVNRLYGELMYIGGMDIE